jgi:PEP-CTERM motif
MRRLVTICLVSLVVCGLTSVAVAGSYTQPPDPLGWDVSFTNAVLADDWQCTQSGPVSSISFWVSFKSPFEPPQEGDFTGPDLHISICSDIPAREGQYSMPGNVLWESTFSDAQGSSSGGYNGGPAGNGDQGWFDPSTGDATAHDHTAYYLVSTNLIENPFTQEVGTIYWLEIAAILPKGANYEVGWKTSTDHSMDDAVWNSPVAGWQDLQYPENDPLNRGGESIDLAFVITPEPATMCLFGLGALSLIRRKK